MRLAADHNPSCLQGRRGAAFRNEQPYMRNLVSMRPGNQHSRLPVSILFGSVSMALNMVLAKFDEGPPHPPIERMACPPPPFPTLCQAEAGSLPDGSTKSTPTKGGDKSGERGAKRKWFDYDKVIPRAQRQYASQQAKFEEDVAWVVGIAKSAIDDLGKLSLDKRAKCESEEKVLYTRLEFLSAVKDNDSAKLGGLIAKFKGDAFACTSSGSSCGRTAIGSAPPIASFENLQTCVSVSLISEDFKDASSPDDVKRVHEASKSARKPIKDLCTSVTAVAKEVGVAVKQTLKPPEAAGESSKVGAKSRRRSMHPPRACAGHRKGHARHAHRRRRVALGRRDQLCGAVRLAMPCDDRQVCGPGYPVVDGHILGGV